MEYWHNTYVSSILDQQPSLDTEMTSFALLIYVTTNDLVGGIPAMKWLTAHSNTDGAFRPTQVTLHHWESTTLIWLFFSVKINVEVTVRISCLLKLLSGEGVGADVCGSFLEFPSGFFLSLSRNDKGFVAVCATKLSDWHTSKILSYTYTPIYIFANGPDKIQKCKYCPRVINGHAIELWFNCSASRALNKTVCLAYISGTPK